MWEKKHNSLIMNDNRPNEILISNRTALNNYMHNHSTGIL